MAHTSNRGFTAISALNIYTDGSCSDNPGPGGWAAIVLSDNDEPLRLSGHDPKTTNNRMELTAAIKGLEAAPPGSEVTLFSDSEYLVKTMTRNWKRNVNKDLWEQLDSLSASRQVAWKWVRGHAGNNWNEEADRLAVSAMKQGNAGNAAAADSPSLTHLDQEGSARMVDVGSKPVTDRQATATGYLSVSPETVKLIQQGLNKKGDVLTVAQLAGIMGAKRTSDLIPLCHPLPLNRVDVQLELDAQQDRINVTATVSTSAKTGVEMEALTAVSVAALTVYDMCKSADRGIRIEGVRLLRKSGGQSGDITLE